MLDGLLKNQWLWFHMLAGAIAAKILLIWLDPHPVVLIVTGCAVAWEVFEYFITDVEKVYGNKKRWFFDTFFDIVGALIMALIVVM